MSNNLIKGSRPPIGSRKQLRPEQQQKNHPHLIRAPGLVRASEFRTRYAT